MPRIEFYSDHNENVKPVLLATLESDYIPEKGSRMWIGEGNYEVNHVNTVIDYAGTLVAKMRVVVRLYPRGKLDTLWAAYRPKLKDDLTMIEWVR